MPRAGIFVCHCGINIAGTVEINRVLEALRNYRDIICAKDYKYMCSDPGQNMIRETIKDKGLDRVIVAACSPTLHEITFRKTVEAAGLNPYQCEIANIREHCSWVHNDKDRATTKAIEIIKIMLEKVRFDDPLLPIKVPLVKKALVIGGGVSGIQAALDIANSGHDVILVEEKASIGGHMAELSELLITREPAVPTLVPKIEALNKHPKIEVFTYSEVDELKGYIGNFEAKIRKKATFVDWDRCDGCGLCMEKCPAIASSKIQQMLGKKHAIYVPYAKMISNKPVIDKESCLHLKANECKICKEICPKEAIEFEQADSFIEIDVGCIVVATGYELYSIKKIREYGYGKYKDVIDALEFERLLAQSGPSNGKIRRPSDGKTPKEVVFIQCVGLMNPKKDVSYCSKVCCMYTAKQALLYKKAVPDGMAYIFYTNLMAGGKNFEEFINEAWKDNNVLYLRGKVSKINGEGEKLVVYGEDTIANKKIEIESDLVVLCPAMVPTHGAKELANKLKITCDEDGFYTEAHPKLKPLESLTAGFYLAGCGQAPKDVSEAIVQASGTAAKVSLLFSNKELAHDPIVAWVDDDLCAGCGLCVSACTYEAREINQVTKVAEVTEILCQGCGACITACPNGATQQKNFSKNQVLSIIDAVE